MDTASQTTTKRNRFRVRNVLRALLIVYAVVMISGCLPDRLILYPSTNPVEAGPARRREITWNGGRVEVWVADSLAMAVRSREPEAYVLTFVGNASRAEYDAPEIAMRWGDHPVQVWAVNYPGYGGSTGPARLKSIPGSALAAYDELQRQAGGRPIYLSGVSLGTTAALYVAANRPCAGVTLQNPPPLQNMILGHFGWWNLWLLAGPVAMQIPSDLNSLDNGPRVTVPAVFLLADCDEVVPPKYHRKVVDTYAGPKKVIVLRGCGHNSPLTQEAYLEFQQQIDWMWQQRPVATTRPTR